MLYPEHSGRIDIEVIRYAGCDVTGTAANGQLAFRNIGNHGNNGFQKRDSLCRRVFSEIKNPQPAFPISQPQFSTPTIP
jgi:hypothetical protein